ncbi:hypothetical protein [Bacillus suaedaesalsae]|uniref:Secreted protein n=1 Tax=Bacillus suaedaesalsae TaxID=2810349 RepID=A0ABS2DH21_9BACI|nr:hypothetical protein [Bacillus suaedaesalsae]MBM6617716.1 hypothetical protein [Bacillus suaedaesalsae]
MKKWVLSAVGYLVVVILGYTIYSFTASPESPEVQTKHGGHGEEVAGHDAHGSGEESEGHGEHGSHDENSESGVDIDFIADGTQISIQLKDKQGQPLNELDVNHEKLLHLIVVDEHLEQYYHLHPEKTGEGSFEMNKALGEGSYKAFVDIKPTNAGYHVEPIEFTVGEAESEHGHNSLKPDTVFNKTVEGIETNLEVSSFKAGEDITLTFSFKDNVELQPYLGAMGHVVILDETAANFIHVHPVSDSETKFQTNFQEPGIYKLWAEFQIDEKVHTYPFVIEIK